MIPTDLISLVGPPRTWPQASLHLRRNRYTHLGVAILNHQGFIEGLYSDLASRTLTYVTFTTVCCTFYTAFYGAIHLHIIPQQDTGNIILLYYDLSFSIMHASSFRSAWVYYCICLWLHKSEFSTFEHVNDKYMSIK